MANRTQRATSVGWIIVAFVAIFVLVTVWVGTQTLR
jgi:hypothetical protein